MKLMFNNIDFFIFQRTREDDSLHFLCFLYSEDKASKIGETKTEEIKCEKAKSF